jgi:hypothetical protein
MPQIVQARVLSVPAKTAGGEEGSLQLSLRPSVVLGLGEVVDPVITSAQDLTVDQILRGYVSSVAENGIYVALVGSKHRRQQHPVGKGRDPLL